VSHDLIHRLAHLNRFLEQVFGEPTRLSDILLRSGLSPSDIESIKRLQMEAIFDSVCYHLVAYLREVLPPKHARVVADRFCLSGPDQPTLQAIADELDLSRERIRQLQNKGFKRLRPPSRRIAIEGIVVTAATDLLRETPISERASSRS